MKEPVKYINVCDQQLWQEMSRDEKGAYLNPEWIKWNDDRLKKQSGATDEQWVAAFDYVSKFPAHDLYGDIRQKAFIAGAKWKTSQTPPPIPQSENKIEGEPEAKVNKSPFAAHIENERKLSAPEPEAKYETPVEYIQRMQVEATDNQEVPRCGCKSGEDCDARCMPSYDSQDIERAYCAGYINGSSAVGSCIQAMGDGKLESAWKRYANSGFVAHCIAREDTEITELLKTKEAEISSLKEKLDKAKDLSRDWYDEKNRAEILEGKLGKQEIDIADLYAFKDLSVKQGLRIKVLEKEIEVARQTAQRFLEQNVLLVDERGRYLEAAEKARAVAALDWAARNRLEKYSPGWSIARPGAWQIETFKELLKVYDAFADDELEKNKTHQP